MTNSEEIPDGANEKTNLLDRTATTHQRCLEFMTVEWRLALYKIQYFFLMGAESVDRVYLQLFLKQTGQSTTRIGIITSVALFVVSCTNAIIGALASRYGISKAVLLFSSFAAAVVAFGTAVLQLPREVGNCTLDTSTLANMSSMDGLVDLKWLYVESDVNKFFYVMLCFHTAFQVFRSLTMAFTDVSLISALGETGMHKYSRQKSFGSLGSALLDLSTGPIVALTVYTSVLCGIELTTSDYQIANYIVGGSIFICFLVSWTFPFKNENGARALKSLAPSQTAAVTGSNYSKPIQKDEKEASGTKSQWTADDSKLSVPRLMGILWSVHYVSWLLCVFYMSLLLSMAAYAFLYLEELGADPVLIGVVSGVSAGSDFIFYVLAFLIVGKLGTINSLYLTMSVYAVRFAILAIIDDPWLGLIQAALSGCSLSVGWVAIIQHVAFGFSKKERTIMIGIVHGIYFGLGVGTGQLIGGVVIDAIGAKYAFAAMAGATVPVTGLFCLSQKMSKQPSYEVLYETEGEP